MKQTLFDISLEDYTKRKCIQETNQTSFKEQFHGARRKLIVYDRTICSHVASAGIELGLLTKQQFASFLGLFSKQLYKSFILTPELYYLDIKFTGFARNKNYQLYNDLPDGQIFWNVDLSSAYFQIAYRLGYINTKFFDKYMFQDKYKSVKRLCVSFLGRSNKMVYNNEIGNYEINCDTTILRQVYANVRNELYTIIKNISEHTEYIEYNIDGITILPADKQLVKDYFQSLGLEFASSMCTKISDRQYKQGTQIKNFRKPLTNKNK
tara:strand:- start:16942 stop:17739 length:798 start_codon:yes stop_codon:yes gene_type:complete